ncbi:MAG: NAD(P)-dependent oxidoreductase [Gammaproteobacteria bacterium]|nr:NAD(P)-dependent oxidoreductase [Gammaproteobacteria bacterium]
MTQQTGFIGLGAMGAGMARNLLRAGFPVRGYDVQPALVEAFVADGGAGAASPAEAAEGADLLVVIVFTAAQAEAVLFGERGALESLPRGATVIMHTTTSPQEAEAMSARLAERGYAFLDAPVTGGKKGADEATLTIIVSGPDEALAAAQPAFEQMGRKIARVGDRAGAASTVKMINQMLCGIHVVATAEAMVLAARGGADPRQVYDVITHGAGNSFVFETRVPSILARDYSPKGVVEIFTKDLGIVTEAARRFQCPVPLTALALQQFLAAAAAGYTRNDDISVVKIYEQLAGVDVADTADR